MKNKKNILITGGTGNLGSLVATKLLEQGHKVVKFDLPGAQTESPGPNETIINGDIRDIDLLNTIVKQQQIDTIYHLASLLSGSSEADLEAAWEINATASFRLMKLAVDQGVGQFFFASTAATYSDVDQSPMSQDFPQWPESFYGATKVAVERLGVYFKMSHGLDFRCLRFPLVVSPNAPISAVSAFPCHAFKAALAGEAFSFPVSAETGVSTIFLDDVVNSIVQYTAADPEKLGRHAYSLHTYYLTAGMVAEAICQQIPAFEYSFEPVESVQRLIAGWPDVIDDQSAKQDWGWNPLYDFPQSVERMWQLFK